MHHSGPDVDPRDGESGPGLLSQVCHIAEHMQRGMMFSFNVAC
jgi:hypothetical protein